MRKNNALKNASTLRKGSAAEAMVLADLEGRGYIVCVPFSGHSPFDLLAVNHRGVMRRLQVKYISAKDGFVQITLRRIHTNGQGVQGKPVDLSLIDAFAVYIPDIDVICYVPKRELRGKASFRIRIAEPLPYTGRNMTPRRRDWLLKNRPDMLKKRPARMASQYSNPRLIFENAVTKVDTNSHAPDENSEKYL